MGKRQKSTSNFYLIHDCEKLKWWSFNEKNLIQKMHDIKCELSARQQNSVQRPRKLFN